jgi:hypothetical protein
VEGHASRADEGVARAARDMTRGRRAWVFASPAPHARLRLTGAHGTGVPAQAEELALRVAGVAINAGLPVVVLPDAAGPLADAAFYGVPVPFDDGRVGALVVVAGQAIATRPGVADALLDLASAQVQALGRVAAR